jgi:ABC-2 type transport system permease protein
MNIFLREMKANRKSLIIWCIGLFLMIAGSMSKYSAYSGTDVSINNLIAQMPKSIKSITGMGSFDLSKASGYFGVLYLYLVIIAAIHASMLGANIFSKEERDKTSEFLFVKPVSRNKIMAAKMFAAFVNILIFNILALIYSIALVGYYGKGEAVTGDIIKLMIGMFILQLMFMLLGTGTAAVSNRPKAASPAATGILLVSFFLYILIDLNKNLEIFKYLTPFKYFDAKNLMYGGRFEPVFLILSAVIIAILFCITYVFYQRRDLNI